MSKQHKVLVCPWCLAVATCACADREPPYAPFAMTCPECSVRQAEAFVAGPPPFDSQSIRGVRELGRKMRRRHAPLKAADVLAEVEEVLRDARA